jgi:signal transduction histidine kinase
MLDLVAFIHLAGFVTGVVLYGMLAQMTWRTAGWRGNAAVGGRDGLPITAALLGLVWNCGALVIFGFRDFGLGAPSPWLAVAAFSALGFLPAVVVHSASTPLSASQWRRGLVVLGYLLSTTAAILQAAEAWTGGGVPSRPAMYVMTIGYAAVVAAFVFVGRARVVGARALTAIALAAFAVSAVHLSHHAEGQDSWVTALLGHHASLPLALVILYQDYRFALVDRFLKRALALLVLVSLSVSAYVLLVGPAFGGASPDPTLRGPAVVLGLWVATALVYPRVQQAVGRFVDTVVLRRSDYNKLRAAILECAAADTPEQVVAAVARELGVSLGARRVDWQCADDGRLERAAVVDVREGRGAADLRVPTTDLPQFVMQMGDLAGGRRLLSDDITLLEWTAGIVARRVDELRMAQERMDRSLREQEITQLATQAELQALRAQLNPHFLFNALTTIGHLMREAPERALDTLYQLTGLLRAVLRTPGGELVPLCEELDIVEAYLAVERARFEDRLLVEVCVPGELRSARIPSLLLQPLVENAVKHGIGRVRRGGCVRVSAGVSADTVPRLMLEVADTGAGVEPTTLAARRANGVGLQNIERRLDRHFGREASLTIQSAPGAGTTVRVLLPLDIARA